MKKYVLLLLALPILLGACTTNYVAPVVDGGEPAYGVVEEQRAAEVESAGLETYQTEAVNNLEEKVIETLAPVLEVVPAVVTPTVVTPPEVKPVVVTPAVVTPPVYTPTVVTSPTVEREEFDVPLSNNNTYVNVDGDTVHSPAYAPSQPAGASAICRDGTYSFSKNRRGTCSGHGGVREWLD
ncbi:MAG: DUF3761 domain-containing protein [bacterium]|nr:DUF3761 domain-containing protein [bacterium]